MVNEEGPPDVLPAGLHCGVQHLENVIEVGTVLPAVPAGPHCGTHVGGDGDTGTLVLPAVPAGLYCSTSSPVPSGASGTPYFWPFRPDSIAASGIGA